MLKQLKIHFMYNNTLDMSKFILKLETVENYIATTDSVTKCV